MLYIRPLPSDPNITALPNGRTIQVQSPDGQVYCIKIQRSQQEPLPPVLGKHARSGELEPEGPPAHRMAVDEVTSQLGGTSIS